MDLKFTQESDGWFVEGKIGELDHFAQGFTKDEAIFNYYQSFYWTLKSHMDMYGSLVQIFPEV